VPVPSQDRLGGLRQEGHPESKLGEEGGGSLISTDGVAPIRIVSVSACVIFHCTIKSRRRFLLAQTDNLGKRAICHASWLSVSHPNLILPTSYIDIGHKP